MTDDAARTIATSPEPDALRLDLDEATRRP